MTARVVLRPGCCAATGPADVPTLLRALAAAGRKAVQVPAAPSAEDDDARLELAAVLGLARGAVQAGCPVPFATEVGTWRRVRGELEADRWDVVLVATSGHAEAVELVSAPERLLLVLDARLDEVGPDGASPALVHDLLTLRREAAEQLRVAAAATVLAGCDEPAGALLGLPLVPAGDPLGEAVPVHGVDAEGRGYRWWLRVGGPVEVHRVGEDTLEITSGTVRRGFRLPGALRRCDVQSATVRRGVLQVRFVPDAERWRWT